MKTQDLTPDQIEHIVGLIDRRDELKRLIKNAVIDLEMYREEMKDYRPAKIAKDLGVKPSLVYGIMS